jgi:hypothetical protein
MNEATTNATNALLRHNNTNAFLPSYSASKHSSTPQPCKSGKTQQALKHKLHNISKVEKHLSVVKT